MRTLEQQANQENTPIETEPGGSLAGKITLAVAFLVAILAATPLRHWFHEAGVRWVYMLLISFSMSYCLVPPAILLAGRVGAVDEPSSRRIHSLPTPRLGGLSVFLAFFLAIVVNNIYQAELPYLMIGTAMMMAVGILDDIRGCSAWVRLLVQLASTAVIMMGGVMIVLFPRQEVWGIFLNGLLTILWVVGITNALNFFDGMDGLAAGLGAIIAGFMGIIAYQNGQPNVAWVAVALMGGCLGFLPYNFRPNRPARTFLGDGGSTFIGFTLASLAVMGDWAEGNPVVSIAAPLLLFMICIFDMIHITVTRIARGKVTSVREWIEYVGKDHLHHRMEALLLGKGRAVLFIYFLTVCLGISTLVLRKAGIFEAIILVLQGIVIVLLLTILEWAGNTRERRTALPPARAGQAEQTDSSPSPMAPYRRPLSPYERMWLFTHRRAFAFFVEGEGEITADEVRRALKTLSKTHPGSRLFLKGHGPWAHWEAGESIPEVIVIEGSPWSGHDNDNAPFLEGALNDARNGRLFQVLLFPGKPFRIMFRVHHSVMDFRGYHFYAQDLFRALRGEEVLGADSNLTDLELARRLGGGRRKLVKNCLPVTGPAVVKQRGLVWRRHFVEGMVKNPFARILVALAKAARRHGQGTVAFDVPVDMRVAVPGIRSTANLTGSLRVSVAPEDTSAQMTAYIRRQVEACRYADALVTDAYTRYVPMAIGRMAGNYIQSRAVNRGILSPSAIVSNLGLIDLRTYSTERFHATGISAMPPGFEGAPLFMTVLGTERGIDLAAIAPQTVASGGRLNEILEFIGGEISG